MTTRRRALDLAAQGELAAALDILQRLRAETPDDAGIAFELGLALDAAGRLDDADDALAAAVSLDATSSDARRALASVLDRLGRLDEAVFQLRRARTAAPGDARVARELGTALLRKGLPAKARVAFEDALGLAPVDPRAHYGLGLAHEGERDLAAAIAAYRRAIDRDAGFADARLTLADTLAQLGEHEAAIAELDALLALDRANERAAANREALQGALAEMRAARLLGRPAEALESSALVEEGTFRFIGAIGPVARWSCPWAELHVELDDDGRIALLFLTMKDPRVATHSRGDRFAVSVVDREGRPTKPDWATAATLTLLREGLGIPLTRAATLLEMLYAEPPGAAIEVAAAHTVLASRPHPDRPPEQQHGVVVTLRQRSR